MRVFISFFLLGLLGGTSLSFAQDPARTLQQLRVDVVYLASDLLEGRETGKAGEALAAQYLSTRFEDLGLTAKGSQGWLQAFEARVSNNPHASESEKETRTGHNVIGFLDNGAKQTVVIGAHYDHLGMGHFGSRYTGEPAIHNGADDNASGVAVMLQVAEALVASPAKNNNYLFIGFSGEEMGLYGSKHFVANPTVELESINYLLNLDMVGRLNDEGRLAISGTGTSPIWKEPLQAVAGEKLTIKTSDSGIGPSDHTSFYVKDIPVLHFFSGQHTDYHKPIDDSELINYEGMYEIGTYIVRLIEALDDDGELEFTKTKDESQGTRTRFKVTLGVMPDYVSDGNGMRIDAVLDDRPAKKAGLEDGDVIIKIGDLDINDIQDYMKALGQYEVGDKTTVVVKRGDKEVKKKVTF
ncbi:MAG: M20/M25/M40 family metallo-hydrolase [Bacteroidota bacterium]